MWRRRPICATSLGCRRISILRTAARLSASSRAATLDRKRPPTRSCALRARPSGRNYGPMSTRASASDCWRLMRASTRCSTYARFSSTRRLRSLPVAELPLQERLQPALLDRLTDDEPLKTQEPREQRVMSKSRLRQAVLRDLAWLLNANRLEGQADFRAAPLARRSVINFGLPAFSGRAASALEPIDLERAIVAAIRDFEPRIGPQTLEVRALMSENQHERHNVVGVEIHGQLWSQPVPLEMLVRTEIDLETGEVEIADLGAARGADMDPRLLQYYNRELQYLRELGGEFAEEFPKVAARLGMSGIEVADPYVERLLEGVGFLAARVQLKLDAELPRFTQSLIEIIYPHYLAPTPSMLIAQLKPELTDSNLATGVNVPRGAALQGLLGKDDLTACEFRTAHEVTLWPLEVVAASYFSYAPDLPLSSIPVGPQVKGGVRLRLRATAGLKFNQLALDQLCFYLGGREDVANALYELTFGAGLGALMVPLQRPSTWQEFLPASAINRVGFADEQALISGTHRSVKGHR